MATIVHIISVQFKNKKYILLFFLIANILFCINFLLLKSYTGAFISLVSAVQTCINNIYVDKGKSLPRNILILFIIASLFIGIITYKRLIDVMPTIASILYIFSITQNKEKNIRIITSLNICIWIIYDMFVGAYTAALSDVIFIIFTIAAMYRYRVKKSQ